MIPSCFSISTSCHSTISPPGGLVLRSVSDNIYHYFSSVVAIRLVAAFRCIIPLTFRNIVCRALEVETEVEAIVDNLSALHVTFELAAVPLERPGVYGDVLTLFETRLLDSDALRGASVHDVPTLVNADIVLDVCDR